MNKPKYSSVIPSLRASQLLEQYYFTEPSEIDVEGVIYDLGAFIEYQPLEGAEGNIIINGDRAIITVNSNIVNVGKRRFVLAHELGHFIMHKKARPKYFKCDVNAFLDWNGNRPEETEANIFSSRFLMPKSMFRKQCEGKKFSVDNIRYLSTLFKTSLTATALRFAECGNYPCAIIYSKKGIVQWGKFSDDFPIQFIARKKEVPRNTVAKDVFEGLEVPLKPLKVKAIDWFPEDFNIKKYINWYFYEQCFYYEKYEVIISFLWTY